MNRIAAYVVLILLAFIFASISPAFQVEIGVGEDPISGLAETLAGYDARTPALQVSVRQGRDIYTAACVQCHGRFNYLVEPGCPGPRIRNDYSPRDVHQLLTWGQPVRMPPELEYTGQAFQMNREHPIFRTSLTDSERWAVSIYLNSSWLDGGEETDEESWLSCWRLRLEGASYGAMSGPDMFEEFCATCHGVMGYGNGPLAVNLLPPPRNLRDTVWLAGQSDVYLYSVISDGKLTYPMDETAGSLPEPWTGMPGWGSYLDGDSVNRLTSFVRSFGYTLEGGETTLSYLTGDEEGEDGDENETGEILIIAPDSNNFTWQEIRRLIPMAPVEPPEWFDR